MWQHYRKMTPRQSRSALLRSSRARCSGCVRWRHSREWSERVPGGRAEGCADSAWSEGGSWRKRQSRGGGDMAMTLEGKTALVTGGSRGIGRGIALELAMQGANVVIDFHQNRVAAEEVVAAITAMGRVCEAVQADVGDVAQADSLVARSIMLTGSLDILISNAGITRDALLVRMTDEKWNDVLRTNLTGAFNVTRAAARYMMRQKSGRIVLIP